MNRSYRILIFALLISAPVSNATGQEKLPDESAIPGQSKKSTAVELPGENVVPGTSQKQQLDKTSETAIPESMLNKEKDGDNDSQNNQDNGNGISDANDVIPAYVVPQDDPAFDDPKDKPWLYLNTQGPTATVRSLAFSDDSRLLFAGGQDKALHSWLLTLDPTSGKEKWRYQNPVRWQVQRGQRGNIHSVSAGTSTMAFGGVGATAMTGEIVIVDTNEMIFDRTLYDIKKGHRAAINKVGLINDQTIVSSDMEGRTILWNRNADGTWKTTTLRQGDFDRFDKAKAQALLGWRQRGNSVGVSQSGAVVIPQLVTPYDHRQAPRWNLVIHRSPGAKGTLLKSKTTHGGSVTSIAISKDGKRVVSSDLTNRGRVFFWDLSRSNNAKIIQVGLPVRDVQISADGGFVLIGTAKGQDSAGKSVEAQLRTYQWQAGFDAELVNTIKSNNHVLTSAISPDSKKVAFAIGNRIQVRKLAGRQPLDAELSSQVTRANEIRFSNQADNNYSVAIRVSKTNQWQQFDPANPGLKPIKDFDSDQWLAANAHPQSWKIKRIQDATTAQVKWHIEVDSRKMGQLPIDSQVDGVITAAAWIADKNDARKPAAIVVATSGRNHIYALKIRPDKCEIIRQYRGHSSYVDSISVSKGHRFIVSCSDDATVRFWKLDQAVTTPYDRSQNYWGADFEIRDERVVATNVINDGPLYFRGVRNDDTVTQIASIVAKGGDESKLNLIKEPREISKTLAEADSESMIRFHSSRGGERPQFYLYPAWQPLASLVVTGDREWAFWTPYGYYDASFNGHKMFGWQINKGIDQSPDTFRAAEIKENFERPRLLKRLFALGNVPSAFESLALNTPSDLSDRLDANNRLRPRIRIVSPRFGDTFNQKEITMKVAIETPQGVTLASPKAFANGVPAVETRILNAEQEGIKTTTTYEFDLQLPSESKIKLQVLVATNLGQGAMEQTDIELTGLDKVSPQSPGRKPRLFVLASGINEYIDNQIQQLDFPASNANAVVQTLRQSPRTSDRFSQIVLTNSQVQRATWQVSTDALFEEMSENAGPDDLLVIFLSGHGFRDEASKQYFYLTSNTRRNDVLARRYQDCISFDDLARFASIPCRKLLILDTCHSGAIQSLQQNDMKSIVRAVENDLIFTVTASEGSQQAFESTENGLGLFTNRFVKGLSGEGDQRSFGGNQDGTVDLREAVQYVKATVPQDATRIGTYQFPTASPVELIDFVNIPLTSVKK